MCVNNSITANISTKANIASVVQKQPWICASKVISLIVLELSVVTIYMNKRSWRIHKQNLARAGNNIGTSNLGLYAHCAINTVLYKSTRDSYKK
jgi:hypothetical protein